MPWRVSTMVFLNGINEFHNSVSVLLVQGAELLDRAAGIALAVAVPHDGLDDGLGAAVVQTIDATGADG